MQKNMDNFTGSLDNETLEKVRTLVVNRQFESLKSALDEILFGLGYKFNEAQKNAVTLETLQHILGDNFNSYISNIMSTNEKNLN